MRTLAALARSTPFAILLAMTVLPARGQDALSALAESARRKIDGIVAAGERDPGRHEVPRSTALTEAELNAYLRHHGPEVLPASVSRPEIRLSDAGKVRARAIVDLSEVRKARPRDWRDPLAYLTGSVEVVATGSVTAHDGKGRATLESATVAGVPVPASVVRELLQFFTANEERPQGIDLDRPIELPASIRRVIVERGRMTVVQ